MDVNYNNTKWHALATQAIDKVMHGPGFNMGAPNSRASLRYMTWRIDIIKVGGMDNSKGVITSMALRYSRILSRVGYIYCHGEHLQLRHHIL